MIDVLATVAFVNIREPLVPTPGEIEALLDALMFGVLDDHVEQYRRGRRGTVSGVPELVTRGRFVCTCKLSMAR